MDLKQAKEVAKYELEKSNIVIVASNGAIFNLDNESEISNLEEYAKSNKLQLYTVKPLAEDKAEEVIEEEVKPKKKK
jgi:esterase/lipase superfamily enzyme